jgi:ABC-2 type transport system permease protein
MPIFDQGYQHWSGELTGHSWRWLAIAKHGVRVGMKNRVLRVVLLLSWLPAGVLVFALCVWGLHEQQSPLVTPLLSFLTFLDPDILENPKHFRVEIWTICYDYFLLTELRFSMILILLVGPGLISQDLRFNALPLYFSRPLRRIDYILGKLGVVGWFLGMVLIFPAVIAYVAGMLFSLDITIIKDTFPLLLSCVGYGLVMTLSAGLLILALSSLSRNSRYVALFWLGVWFVSSIVGTILDTVDREHRLHARYQKVFEVQRIQRTNQQMTPQERQKAQVAWRDEMARIDKEFHEEEISRNQTNWRPLVSYSANLARIGERMLNTNASLRKISEKMSPGVREQFLQQRLGPEFPWYWSAVVLAILFGFSVCILNFRVRSLDRLK